jgi:hypothetical protein
MFNPKSGQSQGKARESGCALRHSCRARIRHSLNSRSNNGSPGFFALHARAGAAHRLFRRRPARPAANALELAKFDEDFRPGNAANS